MFLHLSEIPENILEIGEVYFPREYIDSLSRKPFYQESLFARYLISQNIGNMYLPLLSQKGIPIFTDENFWSISHKSALVFVWVSQAPLGLDIEILKERETSLLETFSPREYEILWGKNWENFYRLWTAHESLIKYFQEIKYIPGMYQLVSFSQKETTISQIHFDVEFQFWYGDTMYTILSGKQEKYIYALCL